MVNKDLIKKIISLPKKYYTEGNSSIHSLLEQIDHFKEEELNEEEIADALSQNPSCIVDWLRWSEDKRSSEGWYLVEENGKYVLGYYPGGKFKQQVNTNGADACAAFILRELNQLR
ncbi:MAG: hypothetical protein ACJ75B_12520 [Flavisolibacter sp.]